MEKKDLHDDIIMAALRIGLLFVLLWMCFQIVQPFLMLVIWGAIIATALHPVHRYLTERWNREQPESRAAEVTRLFLVEALEQPDEHGKRVHAIQYAEIDRFAEGPYQNGKRHGFFVLRHANGKKSGEGAYENGKMVGLWTYWGTDGKLEGKASTERGPSTGSGSTTIPTVPRRNVTLSVSRSS